MPRELDYSLMLRPQSLRVLIVGGGEVAARKLKGLPQGIKSLKIISPRFSPGFPLRAGKKAWRKARLTDVDTADLIFAATDNSRLNAALARRARQKGKLVCVADQPDLGNFSVPAVAKAGAIRISVSSSGNSPAFSKALRQWLEEKIKRSKLPSLVKTLGRERVNHKKDPAAKASALAVLRDPRAFARMMR
jgi:precorrin-2 dehydrogenase/sirohydrochlorin ferrochelatase